MGTGYGAGKWTTQFWRTWALGSRDMSDGASQAFHTDGRMIPILASCIGLCIWFYRQDEFSDLSDSTDESTTVKCANQAAIESSLFIASCPRSSS